MNTTTVNQADTEREIAALAHQYWEEEGHPEDRAAEHWQRAERELQRRSNEATADAPSEGGIPEDTAASGKMG